MNQFQYISSYPKRGFSLVVQAKCDLLRLDLITNMLFKDNALFRQSCTQNKNNDY